MNFDEDETENNEYMKSSDISHELEEKSKNNVFDPMYRCFLLFGPPGAGKTYAIRLSLMWVNFGLKVPFKTIYILTKREDEQRQYTAWYKLYFDVERVELKFGNFPDDFDAFVSTFQTQNFVLGIIDDLLMEEGQRKSILYQLSGICKAQLRTKNNALVVNVHPQVMGTNIQIWDPLLTTMKNLFLFPGLDRMSMVAVLRKFFKADKNKQKNFIIENVAKAIITFLRPPD